MPTVSVASIYKVIQVKKDSELGSHTAPSHLRVIEHYHRNADLPSDWKGSLATMKWCPYKSK